MKEAEHEKIVLTGKKNYYGVNCNANTRKQSVTIERLKEELKIAQDYNEALGKDYKELEIENSSLSKRILELEADKGWLIDKIPKWFYVKEKLPPEPEIKDGISYPLTYICAYRIRDNGNETGDFMYMGNGEFLGENKEYPIYAWLSPSVTIPEFKE